MKNNIYALVIHFDSSVSSVKFFIRLKNGDCTPITSDEPLKAFENLGVSFSPKEHINSVMDFINENFDGESEAELVVEADAQILSNLSDDIDSISQIIQKHNQQPGIKIMFSQNELQPNINAGNTNQSVIASRKIAVLGKIHSGKTELIKSCAGIMDSPYSEKTCKEYTEYIFKNGTTIFELNGIDIGCENFDIAANTLYELAGVGLSHVVYCFFSMTGKMEDIERDLIHDFRKEHPEIAVCAAINMSLDPITANEFANVISKAILDVPVFVTLAREMKTRMGYIAPHGVEDLVAFWSAIS